MDDPKIPLNDHEAAALIEAITDPVVQNLVRVAFSHARMRFMSGEFPAAPFDMAFFVRSVASAFARTDIVQKVLDGRSTAEASGWDFCALG